MKGNRSICELPSRTGGTLDIEQYATYPVRCPPVYDSRRPVDQKGIAFALQVRTNLTGCFRSARWVCDPAPVTSKNQAIAIRLSEAQKAGAHVPDRALRASAYVP